MANKSYIIRTDTSDNWKNRNPILSNGEMGYEQDTTLVKYGDGLTPWNLLPYPPEEDLSQLSFITTSYGVLGGPIQANGKISIDDDVVHQR